MRSVSAITNLPYTWIGKLWTQLGSLRSVKDTKPWCFGHFMLILRVSLPSPDSWRHGEEQPVFVHRARWTGVPRTARKIQNKPWQWLSNLHPVLYSWSPQGTYQNPENPEEARTKFDMLHTKLVLSSILFTRIFNQVFVKDFPAETCRANPRLFLTGANTVYRSLIGWKLLPIIHWLRGWSGWREMTTEWKRTILTRNNGMRTEITSILG